MLRRVQIPDQLPFELAPGVHFFGPDGPALRAGAGYALFDTRSHLLPRAGLVEIQLSAPLDGRLYTVRRALDVPEHWQVQDLDTGWLAASDAMDAERWLRANLAVPDDLPLARLFHDAVNFSIPVTLAWLLEEPGLREREFAQLLRTERYPSGLRWLDGELTEAIASTRPIELRVRDHAGQHALFDGIRRRYELARGGSLEADERVAGLRIQLADARDRRERLAALETEVLELQRDLQARRLTLAGLEAQLERWRHWLTVHERGRRGMAEHEPDFQAFQAAAAEATKLSAGLIGMDALRAELLATGADVLALQREQALLEEDLVRLREAEQAASDMAEPVHQQQQVEQQLAFTHERALRLEQANRGLHGTLADIKRVEMFLADVERQIADLEPLSAQAAQVKKFERELDEQQSQLRDMNRHVEQLHFLEVAIRSISGHLDELRRGASVTERMSVKAPTANGSSTDERTVTSYLREAVDHQVQALERQIRDWQSQARDLAAAPQQANQLRANVHHLEQELGSARKVEQRVAALPALRVHAKHLHERLDQLKTTAELLIKEQHDCADAPALLGQLRHDLAALNDPRSERAALAKAAARKNAVEGELRQVQRKLQERQARQKKLEQQQAALLEVQAEFDAQGRRRDDAREGYGAYLAQQAIAELAAAAEPELNSVRSTIEVERHLQEQTEARESGLMASIKELQPAAAEVVTLEAQLAAAETRAADWKARYQLAAEAQAAAEENRSQLTESQRALASHARAQTLLEEARGIVQQADVVLGSRLREQVASAASTYLRSLLGDPEVELGWAWGEAPGIVRTGASHPLDELDAIEQACCVLAFRLALAGDASRLRTVFISGLESMPDSRSFARRLEQLTDFDQFLLPSGW